MLAFSIPLAVSAQKNQYLSFELAGSGGLFSLNYERTLFGFEKLEPVADELTVPKKIGLKLNLRTGLSFTPISKNNGIVLVFRVMMHFTTYKGNHGFDLGLGQSLSISTKGSFFIRMPLSLGYRLEPQDKKFYWRFAYTPIMSYLFGFQYEHWGGITLGYKISKK